MFRNLVLKLPSLKNTSEYAFSSLYRKRSFRSLSPINRVRSVTPALTERSVSCSRAEKEKQIEKNKEKAQARALCFSKEYYASNHQPQPQEVSNEIQWRENPSNTDDKIDQPQEAQPFVKTEAVQFETLEQYELEAARPRPLKSRDLLEAFSSKSQKFDRFCHLQPNQMKPYGSPDNLYSPLLIRPTNSIRFPRKYKKQVSEEQHEINTNTIDAQSISRGQRNYSTSPCQLVEEARKLSTSRSCIAKQGHSTKDKNFCGTKLSRDHELKFPIPINTPTLPQLSRPNYNSIYSDHWSNKLNIGPYRHHSIDPDDSEYLQLSTPAMRRQRKADENKKGSVNYKLSYSDLIKLKLKEQQDKLVVEDKTVIPERHSVSHLVPNPSKKMLDAFKHLPGRRSFTTRSKSNLLSKEDTPAVLNLYVTNPKVATEEQTDQRKYSKCSSSYKKREKSPKKQDREYNPECEDICTSIKKRLTKEAERHYPFEPAKCENDKGIKKVYLPSKVRLQVPSCTPRPDYFECKKHDKCDVERADECLEIQPKTLPKLVANKCPCIDSPGPSIAPKLQKLHFKFEDPPKVVCHEPPCQTPRADDSHPPKYKPLKPYVPKDCSCIQPPPMVDVKLKRLPRCEPEELCRPPRVCPVIELCPPRADECYKLVPKKLPPLEGPDCPCIETPPPTKAPPIKRLNLNVPEPERECKKVSPCSEVPRADDHLKTKKKKLPKFVPGDCPCNDRPMTDWNTRRLQCEDEEVECIVPDPCNVFPRADWGCWEYTQEVCKEMDPKCVDTRVKCAKPPKEKPCRKKSICETNSGILDYRNVSNRKFSNATSATSVKLYQRVKTKSGSEQKNSNTPIKTKSTLSNTLTNIQIPKKPKSKSSKRKAANPSALHLIKELNNLDRTIKSADDRLLFKPKKDDKIDYQNVLKSIACATAQLEKKDLIVSATLNTSKKPKVNTLTVSSRAISTTKSHDKDEKDMKREKESTVKEKCKQIKPSIKSLTCRKACPRYQVCPKTPREHRPSCKCDRVPVCCTKEESPYSAYTDNLEGTIKPFTKTPQWTCNRVQYGFHPMLKKEHDPLDSEKKQDKKGFSTSTLVEQLPLPNNLKTKESIVTNNHAILKRTSTICSSNPAKQISRLLSMNSSKGFLKKTTPNLSTTQTRSLATKIFQIRFPEPCKKATSDKKCGSEVTEKGYSPEIACKTESDKCEADQRWCCTREYSNTNKAKRKPPPFPAFSDCLDEEMENILTECPLDKEKYLRMQPRFMNPPPKPCCLIKPPPPIQGKIDLLKEAECIRDKLCLENKGLTQVCDQFGKPVPLMKSKNYIPEEENKDCKRIEELKKLGRWPPRTLKSTRRFSTNAINNLNISSRRFSTLGLGFFNDVKEDEERSKRIYSKNYHALLKANDKIMSPNNEERIKDNSQKTSEANKIVKLKIQWRIQNLKINEHLAKHNVFLRARRYYSTYKSHIRKPFGRKFSTGRPLLYRRLQYYRGMRRYNAKRPRGPTTNTAKEKCRIKTHKKTCPKFTLNSCPPKFERLNCHRIPYGKECSKPFSPYPAYSECKEHELVAPSCECGYDVERMSDLQPRYSILNNDGSGIVKDFPTQERINRAMSIEYYKCKHGIVSEGQTIGCNCLKDYVDSQINSRQPGDNKDKQGNVVEFLVQDHQTSENDEVTCCSQTPKKDCEPDHCDADRKKLEELCISECLKRIPCDLPEEEKYCICKEQCQQLFSKENNKQEVKENCPEPRVLEEVKENCPEPRVLEEDKENHPELRVLEEKPKCTLKPKKMDCEVQKERKLKNFECVEPPKRKFATSPNKPGCKEIMVKAVPCTSKKSGSFTQLETIWQKVVNYFKARPNCPQPGDYKKKALREKAEKAASAAGLVVIDPKCISPNLLKCVKPPKKDCKVCPNEEQPEPKAAGGRSCLPEPNKRHFSYYQPSRQYSKSISCKNLEEINKILEEAELKQQEIRYLNNTKNDFNLFPERRCNKTSEELKMSIDMALYKPVDLFNLCNKDGKYPRTYFGYSNIIPSRENILERAWRVSIEAYNRYNYPRTYNFFDFFTQVEQSIKKSEDLEKLKTEDVLRELDKLLQNDDTNSSKKKK